jgi:hypothetical protein
MTDPSFTPESERELLVVYPTAQQANQARTALLDAGVADADIHVGEEPDVVAALRAEMHQELTDAWVVPNAAVAYTKESAHGLLVASAIGALIGLVAAFPLALIDVGSSYWVRFIVFAAVGVAFGLAIALVAGPALGANRPAEEPAGVRGTVLRVEHDSHQLRQLLADLHPIRLDEMGHDGTPIATVTTEGPDTEVETAVETVKDMAANVTGDDYHEER